MEIIATVCILLSALVGLVVGLTVAIANEDNSKLTGVYKGYAVMLVAVLLTIMGMIFAESNIDKMIDEDNNNINNKIEKSYEDELLEN